MMMMLCWWWCALNMILFRGDVVYRLGTKHKLCARIHFKILSENLTVPALYCCPAASFQLCYKIECMFLQLYLICSLKH